jgi:hypothetical protein
MIEGSVSGSRRPSKHTDPDSPPEPQHCEKGRDGSGGVPPPLPNRSDQIRICRPITSGHGIFEASIFCCRYPYCYGYWKKFADFEKRNGTPERVMEVFNAGTEVGFIYFLVLFLTLYFKLFFSLRFCASVLTLYLAVVLYMSVLTLYLAVDILYVSF